MYACDIYTCDLYLRCQAAIRTYMSCAIYVPAMFTCAECLRYAYIHAAICTCDVKLQYVPVCHAPYMYLRCSPALPACDMHLRCVRAIQACDIKLRYVPAICNCDIDLRCVPAIRACDIHLRCSHAIRPLSFCDVPMRSLMRYLTATRACDMCV